MQQSVPDIITNILIHLTSCGYSFLSAFEMLFLLLPFLLFASQVIVSFRVSGCLSSSFFHPLALSIRHSNTRVKKALPSLKESVSLPHDRIAKV